MLQLLFKRQSWREVNVRNWIKLMQLLFKRLSWREVNVRNWIKLLSSFDGIALFGVCTTHFKNNNSKIFPIYNQN
jgi:hypothetical protein